MKTPSPSRSDRRKRTKRNRRISLAVLVIVAASSYFWSTGILKISTDSLANSWTPFSVDTVSVLGLNRVDRDSLLALADIHFGNSTMQCNTENFRQRIETHPWIQSAIVRRKLPNELVIVVKERVPVALLRTSPPMLLTSDGVAVPTTDESWIWDLPILSPSHEMLPHAGAKVEEPAVQEMLSQIHAAKSSTSSMIENISEFFVRDHELFATLIEPPVAVRLGHGASATNWAALQELIRVERNDFWGRSDIEIDLRVDGSIIVSKKPEAEIEKSTTTDKSTIEKQVKA